MKNSCGIRTSATRGTYQINEDQNRESIGIQKEMYNRELMDTKRKFFKAASHYSEKENDPFYKVQDRGSSIQENSDSYVIKAYVPEHEKNNVKVTVHQDKVVIAGERAFKDSG